MTCLELTVLAESYLLFVTKLGPLWIESRKAVDLLLEGRANKLVGVFSGIL